MACGSCGGHGRQPGSLTTGMVNEAAGAQQYKVIYPDGSSETYTQYIDAVRAKKQVSGAKMLSV